MIFSGQIIPCMQLQMIYIFQVSYALQVLQYMGELLNEGENGELSSCQSDQEGNESLFGLIGVKGDKMSWSGRQWELNCGALSKDG